MTRIILLSAITFFIVGCNNNTNKNTQNTQNSPNNINTGETVVKTPVIAIDPITEVPVPTCESGEALVKGQVFDIQKRPLPNITIKLNGCTTTTDSNGTYTINNVKAKEKGYVDISSNNYASTSIPIEVRENLIDINETSKNYTYTILSEYNYKYKYHSSKEFEKPIIFISKDNYHYPDRREYYGDVNLRINSKQINTKESRRNFPGEFKGKNLNGVNVLFKSLALMEISIKDKNNKDLLISEPANIVFFNVNSNKEFLPLWKFDEKTHTWIEVDKAYRREDGSYEADINQVGIWAINEELEKETGTFIGRIIYENGEPVKNVRVYLTGKNWITSQLSSNTNGEFEIPVVADEDFSIYVFTFKDNYIAEYTGDRLGPVASGEVMDDRT